MTLSFLGDNGFNYYLRVVICILFVQRRSHVIMEECSIIYTGQYDLATPLQYICCNVCGTGLPSMYTKFSYFSISNLLYY